MSQPELSNVIARFTFKPDRAHEFCDDGREVIEMECIGVGEVIEYTEGFYDALVDVTCLINGKVINLSDFSVEA